MATLDTSDPTHPTFSYPSDGYTVEGGLQCNCEPSNQECLSRCHVRAQEILDATLAEFPED
jgi:hypothetical protein